MAEFGAIALVEEPTPYHYNRTAENLQRVRGHKNHAQKSTALQQAIEMQRIGFKAVCLLEKDLDSAVDAKSRASVAMALRQAMAAYESASDLVRIAKNKPLPGSLRPESKPRAKAKAGSVSFSEAPAPIPNASSPGPSQSGPTT